MKQFKNLRTTQIGLPEVIEHGAGLAAEYDCDGFSYSIGKLGRYTVKVVLEDDTAPSQDILEIPNGYCAIFEGEDTPCKKLKDVLPTEALETGVWDKVERFLDVDIIQEFEGGWEGTHKHVMVWWKLANGYAVGWNENPARGWSFPIINLKSKKKGKV